MKQNMRRHSGLGKKSHTESSGSKGKKLHKDWRVWLAVILMLAAIIPRRIRCFASYSPSSASTLLVPPIA